MDIQRLRNLTTGKLHTKMDDIYEDLEKLTGIEGVMTHQLPGACRALRPWLKQVAPDARLWDGKYDPSHTGEIELPECSQEEANEILKRFAGGC